MLTDEQKLFRKLGIGGSDANIIMGGDDEKLLNLWLEKRGQRESDDLSDVLIVQMGNWTEPHNRAWFEKNTGRKVTDAGEQRICLDYPFMLCTLDGMTDGGRLYGKPSTLRVSPKPMKWCPSMPRSFITT